MDVGPVPILLYHAVVDSNDDSGRWSVAHEVFEAQLDLLVEARSTPLSVSEYAEVLRGTRRLPARPVVVTFDDGFANFLQFAAPALAARSIPSTLYVPTSALWNDGGGEPFPGATMLDEADLPVLERFGVEIGAHSHTHRTLDTLASDEVTAEVWRPKQILEDILGHEIRSFAYPHGYSNQRVRRCVEQCGYRSACAVRNAFSSVNDNVFAIARLCVERETPMEVIESWIEGIGAPLAQTSEQLRTRFWRICRRAGRLSGAVSLPRMTVPLRH